MSDFEEVVRMIRQSGDQFLLDRLNRNADALRLHFWENHFEHRALANYPCLKGHILDFGCGTGHADIWLARNGSHVFGIDINETAIRIARFLLDGERAEVASRLGFSTFGEMNRTSCFDSVWSSNVFEHIADPGGSIETISRLCKKGAPVLISVPQGYHYNDPDHVHHFMTTSDLMRHFDGLITPLSVEHDSENHMLRLLGRIGDL